MKHFCVITVDADRDYPVHTLGKIEAKSFVKKDTPEKPAIEATSQGIEILLDLFEEFEIKAPFFIEASILPGIKEKNPDILRRLQKHDLGNHGFSHEDFTGKLTGVQLTDQRITDILQKAVSLTKRYVGEPKGFRAPYLNFDSKVAKIVSRLFEYDSSITLKQASSLDFLFVENLTIPELPLVTTMDKNGKPISTYLWQLLEGNRPVEDYLTIIKEKRNDPNFPFTIFAIHPWHIAYHIGRKELLDKSRIDQNVRNLKIFFQEAGQFGTIHDALNIVLDEQKNIPKKNSKPKR